MNFILASTSSLYNGNYLDYIKEPLKDLFTDIQEIIFIPYARPSGISHDEYTNICRKFFKTLNIQIKGLHEFENPIDAINNSQAIFTGGGNTFLLLKTLYDLELMKPMRQKILSGNPYLGTSAGSNIVGKDIRTTNDMPIVYPPSFKSLEIVPFNINPHYLDPDPNLKHNGETRETRILEFLCQNNTNVIGLREGSWIRGEGENLKLGGELEARIFIPGKKPFEIQKNSDLNFLKA